MNICTHIEALKINQDWMTFAHVEGLRLLDQNLINYFQNFANGTKFLKRTKPSSNLIKKLNDVD
jgi:hypothetical protein